MSLLVRWSEPIVLFISMSLSPVVTPFVELKWTTRLVTDLNGACGCWVPDCNTTATQAGQHPSAVCVTRFLARFAMTGASGVMMYRMEQSKWVRTADGGGAACRSTNHVLVGGSKIRKHSM